MNEQDRGTLLGLIFGDGCIAAHKNSNTATLRVKHSLKQRGYAEHKADLVAKILGGKRPPVRIIDNSGYPGCAFDKTDSYFRVLRNWLYKDGKKRISRHVRWLTPHGLAIWYMDDGGLGRNKRNGKIHAVRMYLNCHTDREEAQAICDALAARFGIQFRPISNNGSYRISCGTAEARRFADIVRPFIHVDMLYKIDIPEKLTSARDANTDCSHHEIV